MRTIDQKSTAGRSVDAAQRRAAGNPEANLPCPACATGLKGANFDRHLREKHPDATSTAPGSKVADLTLVGIDHRIRRTFAGLVVLWFVVVSVVMISDPSPSVVGNDPSMAEIAREPVMILMAVGALVAALIAVLWASQAFRARLTVTQDSIRLSHRMGTGRRSVALPIAVDTGTLFASEKADNSGGRVDTHLGAYLHMGRGRRSVVVGCPHDAGVRKHWVGWTSGKRRKRWDVSLSAPAFVELQYALAQSGCIVPAP